MWFFAPKIYRVTAVLLLLAVTACASSPRANSPTPGSPNTFTGRFLLLDTLTVTSLAETLILSAKEYHSRVGQVDYMVNRNVALAVYPNEGRLLGWNLETGEIVTDYKLGIASNRGLGFNATGELLMGATHELSESSISVTGIGLWSTTEGRLSRCFSFPCDGTTTPGNHGYLGAVLDATGDSAILFSDSSVVFVERDTARSIYINDLDSNIQRHIGQVAIDSATYRHALVFRDGGVWLSTDSKLKPYRTVLDGNPADSHEILTAKFDPAGHYLAYLTTESNCTAGLCENAV